MDNRMAVASGWLTIVVMALIWWVGFIVVAKAIVTSIF